MTDLSVSFHISNQSSEEMGATEEAHAESQKGKYVQVARSERPLSTDRFVHFIKAAQAEAGVRLDAVYPDSKNPQTVILSGHPDSFRVFKNTFENQGLTVDGPVDPAWCEEGYVPGLK